MICKTAACSPQQFKETTWQYQESNNCLYLATHSSATARDVPYLPILQLMAFYRSMAKDLNPDRPNNLTAVVKLDL